MKKLIAVVLCLVLALSCTAVAYSLVSVAFPARPSAVSPWSLWKARTAAQVVLSYIPAVPTVYPRDVSASCILCTSCPVAPGRSVV